MTQAVGAVPRLNDISFPSWSRMLSLLGAAVGVIMLPLLSAVPDEWTPGILAVGGSFLAVFFFAALRGLLEERANSKARAILAAFLEKEPAPGFISDSDGTIVIANSAARSRFNAAPGNRLDRCLRSVFANPSPILLRMHSRAVAHGRAAEDIVSKGASIPVLTVDLGNGLFLWRIKASGRQQWAHVSVPVVTLGHKDSVLAANPPAQDLLSRAPDALQQILSARTSKSAGMVRIEGNDAVSRICVTELKRTNSGRDLALIEIDDTKPARWAPAVADLPVPLLRLSLTGDVIEANHLAAKLLGDFPVGQTNIGEIMQGLNRPVSALLEDVAQREAPPCSEFLRLRRKDKDIYVQVTLSRVVNDGEAGLLAVLHDATELKTLEAQFVQGQKMQAVGQLAGGVAHDFNNLLTAISGHCDLLLLRHDASDPDYADLVQINQNANRAAALVGQLLAFSRKQTLRPEVLDLRDTISDLIHLLNRLVGEKIRLILSHDPVLKPVRADKRQLEQVLMNLVVNARDAMPDGGDIRIETEVVVLTEEFRRDRATVAPGEYVSVKVVDSGVGIPGDKLDKVFEPFFTTKRTGEGTGLGLSTVYGIVKQTGGFIFVDSVEGRGSEFNVLLPVCNTAEPEKPPEHKPEEPGTGQSGEGVVLLVEDEAPVRAFATRALRLKGYTVLEAGSAEEALKLLEDVDLHVDVFVTDVVMPGMDGPTWVSKARIERPDVRVVFMSGYTEGAFGESGPDMPDASFLPKPFSLTQLTEAVQQHLN